MDGASCYERGGVSELISVEVRSEQAAEVLGPPLTLLSPASPRAAALPATWCAEVTFVVPDEGAADRCAAVARAAGTDRPIVWARKRRTPTGIEHLGLVGSPTRRAVVVDDILDTGAARASSATRTASTHLWGRPSHPVSGARVVTVPSGVGKRMIEHVDRLLALTDLQSERLASPPVDH